MDQSDQTPRYLTQPLWRYALVGLAAGCIATTFGIGGGVLMVPVLSMWFGVPIKKAVGTSLIAIVGITITGVIVEQISFPDHILWRYSAMLAGGSLIGVRIGKKLNTVAPDWLLKFFFTGLLLFGASKFLGLITIGGNSDVVVYELIKDALQITSGSTQASLLQLALALALGVLAGIGSASLGSGGGLIYVPGLVFLFAEFSSGHPPRATSLAAVVITSSYGAFLHGRSGNIVGHALKSIFPFSIIGAIGGVFLASMFANADLLVAFAFVLIIFAVQMLVAATRELQRARRAP